MCSPASGENGGRCAAAVAVEAAALVVVGVLCPPHLKALTWMGKSHDPGADKTRTQICVQNRVTSLYLERLCPQNPRRQFGPFGVIPSEESHLFPRRERYVFKHREEEGVGGVTTWHTHVAVIKQTNGRPTKISICRATRLAGLNISFGEKEEKKKKRSSPRTDSGNHISSQSHRQRADTELMLPSEINAAATKTRRANENVQINPSWGG